MAANIIMQARDSVSLALVTWVVAVPDWTGASYPGPGSPSNIVASYQPATTSAGSVPGQAVVAMADANQNVSSTQASQPLLKATDALTADRTLLFPAPADDGHAYSLVVRNATSGGHNIIVSTGVGSPLTVGPGLSALIGFDASGPFAADTGV